MGLHYLNNNKEKGKFIAKESSAVGESQRIKNHQEKTSGISEDSGETKLRILAEGRPGRSDITEWMVGDEKFRRISRMIR